ncbi:MAG: trimethylamine methyltransferase family protein [Anaerolineales bacterium]
MNGLTHSETIANLVHENSVDILTDVGFCVPDEDLLTRLDKAGFIVDRESQMVRITLDLLETALKSLPGDFVLYSRDGAQLDKFGKESCFMGAGTPVNVFDLDTGEHRSATRQDVRQVVTIQDALPQVDIVRPTVTATDQGEYSDLVEIAELLRNTTKPIVHRTLSPDRVDPAAEMLFSVAGGEEAFRAKPNFATLYCPISPGYFTPENIHCMLKWAEHGIPITLLSMAMGGASAPATLLGELIVINTDILAWIVVLQILFPKMPLLYGSVSAVLDMKTGLLPLGAPERGMINSGAAIMGNYYGMRSMCGGLSSDAKELDAQAGFEKVTTAIPLLQEGASIIYGVGATNAGSTISYQQLIFDNEIIAGIRRMWEGIKIHDPKEEVELIKSLTPRGNFMSADHTRLNYRRHWYPEIISRDTYDTWKEKGQPIDQICSRKAQEIVDTHQPPPLPGKAAGQIESIMRRYIPDFGFEN